RFTNTFEAMVMGQLKEVPAVQLQLVKTFKLPVPPRPPAPEVRLSEPTLMAADTVTLAPLVILAVLTEPGTPTGIQFTGVCQSPLGMPAFQVKFVLPLANVRFVTTTVSAVAPIFVCQDSPPLGSDTLAKLPLYEG